MTRHFLSEEAAPRFSQARIDAIVRIGQLAQENEANFIVVAGDVFESNQLSRIVVGRTVEALKALPVPVFLLPGNHDPLDASSIFLTSEFTESADHVFVIHDMSVIPVPGVSGVEVVGAPWRTKHPSTDLTAEMIAGLGPATNSIRVAVGHGQVDVLSPDTSRPEIIGLQSAESGIRDQKIHYLALGDRHSVTEVGDTGRIWYSGAPVATDFVEDAPNKALLVELDTDGSCNVEPLDVGDWCFIAEHFDLNGAEDLKRIADWLTNIPSKERAIVKIGFTGTINLETAASLDKLMNEQEELFASLRRRERTTDLSIVPDELDQEAVSLTGYAKETWDELMETASDDETAQDALRLFYRLSHQGEKT